MNHLKHILMILLIGLTSLSLVVVWGNLYFEKLAGKGHIQYGVSFSPEFTRQLGLDWKKTYQQMFTDLNLKYIRIPTYWSTIEPSQNKFDFSEADYMLDLAAKNKASVLLVLGVKQPRWPECQIPDWARTLSVQQRQSEIYILIAKVIDRYKNNKTIWGWQVENEPLFVWGQDCDKPDKHFLEKEVALVRKLDNRPLVLSDSGELGWWESSMHLSDIFGTTLYRTSFNQILGFYFWPIPPAFYDFKSNLIRNLFARNNQKTIIVELQGEPWSVHSLNETPLFEQLHDFPLSQFKANLDYAKKTGFDEIYLWGVEWWYYMQKLGHPEYLEQAKQVFK